MKLISQLSDLKAVSGGYTYDEFVTANTIFYHSVYNAVIFGAEGGIFGCVGGVYLGKLFGKTAELAGVIALGSLGTAAGGYFGYNYNEYSDIEPNTWVRWNIVYY